MLDFTSRTNFYICSIPTDMRKGRDGTIHKKGYPSVLHLNDEMLVIVGNTIDIKDAAAEIISISSQFLILECYILDLKLAFKQVIQKINQQVLAELLTEETLKAPVGKGVDVSTHNSLF